MAVSLYRKVRAFLRGYLIGRQLRKAVEQQERAGRARCEHARSVRVRCRFIFKLDLLGYARFFCRLRSLVQTSGK